MLDIEEKHTGITRVALTVVSLDETKNFMSQTGIRMTGSFKFGGISTMFMRDPDHP